VSLYNADGRGYGLFPADMAALQLWDRLEPVQRGAAMIGAYEQLLSGAPLGIEQYYEQLQQIVQREENTLLLELALGQLHFVYYSLLDEELQNEYAQAMESVLWSTMLSQPDSNGTKMVFRFYARLASSPYALAKLYDIWIGKVALDKLLLGEDDRMELAQTLAIRLPAKSAAIVERQLDETQNPDRRRRFEFLAPSLSAELAVRDNFFESLRDERNRQTETWVSAALRNLHHPARLDSARRYVLPSLELLEEIQVTGDIFFPSAWLAATLANHHSPAVAQTVRKFLQQRPGYNPQLRMKILQAADPLFRASTLRIGRDTPRRSADDVLTVDSALNDRSARHRFRKTFVD
jgi:aminopeptidase N